MTSTSTEEYARHARRINGWLQRGTLRAKIARVPPLAEAATAHRLLENGRLLGKVVLLPG